MKKILIVDDEIKLRDELSNFLKNNGYDVLILNEFNNVVNDILNMSIDLILLDINLPNIDGEYICHELRKKISTPIIMVTSKNNEIDELISINYGADDYIIKPYNPKILLARVNRILNRDNLLTIIKYKESELNITKSVISNNNKSIILSSNELKILVFLLNNIGKIMKRDEIMDYLWDNNEFVDDNTLTVNINRLRTKLEDIDLKNVIETRRGQGYIIL